MNIKQLRAKHELSQQELSNKTGIPRARIAKWEEGKGKPKAEDQTILENFFASIGEQPGYAAKGEPMNYNEKSVWNLTESNRMMAESVQKMVNALLGKVDTIQANLDKIPDSMTLLTDLLLKGQEREAQGLARKLQELEQMVASAGASTGKKPLQRQKH